MDFKKILLVGAIVLTRLCFSSASQGVSINVKIYAGDIDDSHKPSCSKYSASSEEDVEKFMRKELKRVTKHHPGQHVTIETEIVTSGGERHIFTTTHSAESRPNPASTSTNVLSTESTDEKEKVPESPTESNRTHSPHTPTSETVEAKAQNETTETEKEGRQSTTPAVGEIFNISGSEVAGQLTSTSTKSLGPTTPPVNPETRTSAASTATESTPTTMPEDLITTTISATATIETTSGGARIPDCKIAHNSTCYWVHKTRFSNLTYDDADAICRGRHNSSVATVPNNDTYVQMMEELRDGLPDKSNTQAWTSIRVNASTGMVVAGSFINWRPGYPKNISSKSDYIAVSLMAFKDPSQSGMLNHPQRWKRYGVVCEFTKP